ncbi:hypothetical protein L210DRAFT_3627524 [Boletus edulis BED1]|uniref:RanBD1 domain-containing protein n=1 Tax=Boletus edulis BED1 TaxID=1328754 RepID=A0AAD4GK48_BOLED|nr:hypothetical protein L210DRAFT_3627524 [Boletus edulis BED1]
MSEFHFAFCGIATVAATLGYACARRAVLALASPDEPSKADVEAGPSEERSLKRKLDDSDEHDADTEEQSRPIKRNRTPPIDQHESDDDEWEVIVAPPPYEQPQEPVQDKSTPHAKQNLTPLREISPQPEEKGAEAGLCATPQPPQVNLSPNKSETLPASSIAPSTPPAPAKFASANAFSAFSGSSSPFASYSSTGASPFAISGQIVRTAPAWRRDDENELDVFGRAGPANALAPSPNDAAAPATTQSPILSQSKSTPAVPRETKSFTYLSGEEDETVEAELKGVKLFVKRGRKEFTDGMYGHIKILAQKSALQKTDNEDSPRAEAKTDPRTRLLFRRDPLGQVSMNVGLHPTVRCHFDTAENILRVILMEQATTDTNDSREDVVVYALKPGRAQKADFQSFANTLCDHKGLQSRAVTSPTTPASGAAAAL